MMRTERYAFKPGSRLDDKKAATVAKRFKRIRSHAGSLTAQSIVDDAKATDSPLHGFFEWNNGAAAGKYRLQQAAHLVRSLTVVYTPLPGKGPKGPVRAVITIKAAKMEGAYLPTCEVLADVDMRAMLLQQALNEADEWKRRYEHLSELADVFVSIEKAKARAKKRRKRKGKAA